MADGQMDVKEELGKKINVEFLSCSPGNNEEKESRYNQ
jgi:hypothetical protein